MNPTPLTATNTHLLRALFDASERTAWSEFDARYRPVIFQFARRVGIDDEAAAEIAQNTLVDFWADYHAGKFDRARGRLRAWIFGIARHQVASYRRARGRRREWRRESALDQLAGPELKDAWEGARQQAILERGIEQIQEETKTAPKTVCVFVQVALRSVAAAQVAQDNDMTVAEVYRVKHRLTKRLREIVGELETMYETTDRCRTLSA